VPPTEPARVPELGLQLRERIAHGLFVTPLIVDRKWSMRATSSRNIGQGVGRRGCQQKPRIPEIVPKARVALLIGKAGNDRTSSAEIPLRVSLRSSEAFVDFRGWAVSRHWDRDDWTRSPCSFAWTAGQAACTVDACEGLRDPCCARIFCIRGESLPVSAILPSL
jgi:hypothetical protein